MSKTSTNGLTQAFSTNNSATSSSFISKRGSGADSNIQTPVKGVLWIGHFFTAVDYTQAAW